MGLATDPETLSYYDAGFRAGRAPTVASAIVETWRCLGEACAWGAFCELSDREGTSQPLIDKHTDLQTGTDFLRRLVGLESL